MPTLSNLPSPQLTREEIRRKRIAALKQEMLQNLSTIRHSQVHWMIQLAEARY